MSREAMQQALDMLNDIADHIYFDQTLAEVITALEQALAVNTGEWVGLTDEEIWGNGSRLSLSERGIREFARAIEAKLKEKNT